MGVRPPDRPRVVLGFGTRLINTIDRFRPVSAVDSAIAYHRQNERREFNNFLLSSNGSGPAD
jgi:hypothetical protein